MKKSLFLAVLVLISAGCFAQKKNVSKARNLADAETPDYAAAREAIREALQNEETKGQANTWYVAGWIDYKQFESEGLKAQLGQSYDEQARGNAVYESIDYWEQAYKIAMTPVYDKKGKAKYDTRTVKNILPKIAEYYQSQALIVTGYSAYEKKDYTRAYDLFMRHLNIPDMEMMQSDGKLAAELVKDSTYYTYVYYAGRFAYEAEKFDTAIQTLQIMNSEAASKTALRHDVIYANEFIYQIYIEQQDTVNAVATLQQCIERFPEEAWFVQNLINLYINSGQEEKAVEYLDMAIQREPNVGQYYNSKASILARIGRFDEAFGTFDKALAIEPDNALFLESYGYAYVDLGNKLNDDAAYLDAKAYAKAKKEIDAAFEHALPYFQKAYELEPDNDSYKRSLRQLYYRLGKVNEYNALAD